MRFPRVTPSEALLRVGLAFAFLYPAIDAFFDPMSWLGYFPQAIVNTFHLISIPLKLSDKVLLHGFGLIEVALALWVLLGRKVRVPAFIMALLLFTIVLTNLNVSNFSVVFRDVSIACMALALGMSRRASSV